MTDKTKGLNGIPVESGVNDCYFCFNGFCINKLITRKKTTMSMDWDSKTQCTLTIYGVDYCSEYKSVRKER